MVKKGFTLIELLVVISIIGLLSSVVLASLNTAREKARDARRITDIRQVQNALEIYHSQFNAYPDFTNHAGLREDSCTNRLAQTGYPIAGWDSVLDELVNANIFSSLPRDPQHSPGNTSRPLKCYTYTTSTHSNILLQGCRNIETGVYEAHDQYEYVLHFSTERNPTKGYVINWPDSSTANTGPVTNFSNKPYNNCVFGPKKL